jgi:hypothetical protein
MQKASPSWQETVIRLWPSSLGRQQNSDDSLEKPTRGENLDAFAPRLNCKMGTLLRDLAAKSVPNALLRDLTANDSN